MADSGEIAIKSGLNVAIFYRLYFVVPLARCVARIVCNSERLESILELCFLAVQRARAARTRMHVEIFAGFRLRVMLEPIIGGESPRPIHRVAKHDN